MTDEQRERPTFRHWMWTEGPSGPALWLGIAVPGLVFINDPWWLYVPCVLLFAWIVAYLWQTR